MIAVHITPYGMSYHSGVDTLNKYLKFGAGLQSTILLVKCGSISFCATFELAKLQVLTSSAINSRIKVRRGAQLASGARNWFVFPYI